MNSCFFFIWNFDSWADSLSDWPHVFNYLWRAVDQDGEVVDVFLQVRRDGAAGEKGVGVHKINALRPLFLAFQQELTCQYHYLCCLHVAKINPIAHYE